MNKKRFTVKQRQGATIYSIIDYYGELLLNEGMYYKSNADKLCEWLNTQHELLNAFCKENEELKQFKNEVFKLIDKRIDNCEPTDYIRTIKGDIPVFDCETATEIRVLNELKRELRE